MTEKEKIPFLLAGKNRLSVLTALICLFIATIFWIFNSLNNDYTTVINYPIRFEYNPFQVIETKKQPRSVELAVSGYGWYLLSHTIGFDIKPILIRPENLVADKYITASSLLSLVREQLRDIKVNHFVKDTVFFYYENIRAKSIMLQLDRMKITLPQGKKIEGPVKIDPASIICSGPESVIMDLPDTIFFNVSDRVIEKDFNEDVDISYKPSPLIKQNTNQVRVSFHIQ